MADCEFLKGCSFFNDKMDIEAGLGKLFKRKNCQGSFSDCARYRIASGIGREHVPADLFPNMVDRAGRIIADHG